MLLALGFLTFSLGFDAALSSFVELPRQFRVLIEDGAKLIGIVCWCGYFLSVFLDIPLWVNAQLEAASVGDGTDA